MHGTNIMQSVPTMLKDIHLPELNIYNVFHFVIIKKIKPPLIGIHAECSV